MTSFEFILNIFFNVLQGKYHEHINMQIIYLMNDDICYKRSNKIKQSLLTFIKQFKHTQKGQIYKIYLPFQLSRYFANYFSKHIKQLLHYGRVNYS